MFTSLSCQRAIDSWGTRSDENITSGAFISFDISIGISNIHRYYVNNTRLEAPICAPALLVVPEVINLAVASCHLLRCYLGCYALLS